MVKQALARPGIGAVRAVAGGRAGLGQGLLLGALAGALWIGSRRYNGAAPQLIDWQRVRATALDLAEEPTARDAARFPGQVALRATYSAMVRQSEDLVGEYLGARLPEPLTSAERNSVRVFSGPDWIEANLVGFEQMFEPLERLNARAMRGGTVATVLFGRLNQMLLSRQLGMLLGYLSHRVLGQYDLALLGREPVSTGLLYFVDSNIEQLQIRLGLDAREFRLWIALHETTHAYEFEGHPWVRDHLNGLLQSYFDSVGSDAIGMSDGVGGLVSLAGRVAGNAFRVGYPLELVMTTEQRAIFQRMQALMCLLEGYSNHVMDQVGSRMLPSYKVMKTRWESRLRNKSAGERLVARLTGLEVKLEQYVLGERFVAEVVRQRGITFMNRVWESAEQLPTLDEIRQPARWIARVGD